MKQIWKNIKDQSLFFILYFLFLVAIAIILSNYNREDTARLVSSYWNEIGDVFFAYITHIGDFIVAVLIVVVLLFYRYKYAIIAAVGFVSTALITQLLKKVIFPDAKRPYMTLWHEYYYGELHSVDGVQMLKSNSFPSGHTTSAFSIFLFLALLSKNKWIGGGCVVLAMLTSYSRAYLGHHFLEDVFVGSFIGTFGMLLTFSLLENKKFGKLEDRSFLNK